MRKKTRSIRNILFSASTSLFLLYVLVTSVIAVNIYIFTVGDILSRQIKESSKQVVINYENYFENAIAVSNAIQNKVNNIDVKSEKVAIERYFDDIIHLRSEINGISFYDLNGELIVSNGKIDSPLNASTEDFFIRAKEEPLINNFSKLNRSETEANSFYITISKFTEYNKGESSGVACINFDFTKIVKSLVNIDLGEKGHIVIFDKNYELIYSSYINSLNEDMKALKKIVLGNSNQTINGVDYNIFISTITNTTWKVGVFSNRQEISNAITTFIASLSSVAVFLSIVYIIFTAYISAKISNPLRLLKRQMTKVESLNYGVSSYRRTYGSKEVEELDESFRQMMVRIKDLANKLIEEQENQRKSELKALQNQINPHFLYNTLDSIIYMIDQGKNETAERMITALSKFFRISISRGKNIITFKDEIEHARNYLLIQKLRFGDKFEYTIDVDPTIYSMHTIKLILQPIVENAIAHGLKECQGVGKIEIIGRIEDDLIHISVKDNGFGILESKIEEIYASFKDKNIHNGVGLKNVYERLKIYYGDLSDVKITSTLDVGTTIHLYIPVEGALKYEEN